MNGLGMIASRMQALQERAEKAEAEAQEQAARLADAWDDGANAARDWIAAGAWFATMPTNPHRADLAGEQS